MMYSNVTYVPYRHVMLCPRTLTQLYFGAGTSERKKTLSFTSPEF